MPPNSWLGSCPRSYLLPQVRASLGHLARGLISGERCQVSMSILPRAGPFPPQGAPWSHGLGGWLGEDPSWDPTEASPTRCSGQLSSPSLARLPVPISSAQPGMDLLGLSAPVEPRRPSRPTSRTGSRSVLSFIRLCSHSHLPTMHIKCLPRAKACVAWRTRTSGSDRLHPVPS